MNRLLLPVLLAFWGVMTFLLWRSEYGVGGEFGSTVPAETVWQRMRTAPDDSALEIRRGRERIGRVVWSPNVGQEMVAGKVDDLASEGRVQRPTYYTIDLDGHVQPEPGERAFRVGVQLRFATNDTWESFSLRVSQNPHRWIVSADATNRTIDLSFQNREQEGEEWTRTIRFEEFQNPQLLLAELGAPWAAGLLAGALPRGGGLSLELLATGLRWEARQDWFGVGHSRLRAYRVTLRLSESLRVVLFVSRAGEILRADLPDRWTFINEKFIAY